MPIRPAFFNLILVTAALLLFSSCGGGDQRSAGDSGGGTSTSTDGSNTGGAEGGGSDSIGLQLSTSAISVQEGGSTGSVTVSVARLNGYAGRITLSVTGQTSADLAQLSTQLSEDSLNANENGATLSISIGLSNQPILPQARTLKITARDESNATVTANLTLNVQPTDRPDIYLLAGQSNMVGFSEPGAKSADPGGADEPNSRILQLNVTGNDAQNFPTPASFSDPQSIAVPDPRYVPALDPLHNGFDVSIQGKEGSFIGLGLSFGKRALPNTTANIILVPTAWSNTGFCNRDENGISNLGWLATPVNNQALSGTLLHDRAIARTNLVIAETGGILRGILWHQGEADSDELNCAVNYEQNLQNMVASLRANIAEDARGPNARGANADIPFVVGTMSRGAEFADFNEEKIIVDSVHRNINSLVPFSTVVIADDLVPTAYPCGQGSCIHYGSLAYRELGVRYFDLLQGIGQP